MHWDIKIDESLVSDALPWIKSYAAKFDLSKLSCIYISHGETKKYIGIYGWCKYPNVGERKKCRLTLYLPGPFPFNVLAEGKGYIYKDPISGWPPLPTGSIILAKGRRMHEGVRKYWKRIAAYTTISNYNEGLVFVFSHEISHFLRYTKQIPGRNVESQADEFADKMLEEYRASH